MRIHARSRRSLLLVGLLAAGACGGGRNRYQGMEAEEMFRLARTEFDDGDEDAAIEALERLLALYGDWPQVPDARLMLADAHFAKKDYLVARSEYQRFLDRYAGHPSSPDAAIGICRSLAEMVPVPERDQSYTMEALTSCRNVTIDYAGLPQAREAQEITARLRDTLAEKEYNTASFYFRRGLMDSAIRYYEYVADNFTETDWAHRALLGMVRANRRIGYDDLADEARERLLSNYPDSESAAAVRGDGSGS